MGEGRPEFSPVIHIPAVNVENAYGVDMTGE